MEKVGSCNSLAAERCCRVLHSSYSQVDGYRGDDHRAHDCIDKSSQHNLASCHIKHASPKAGLMLLRMLHAQYSDSNFEGGFVHTCMPLSRQWPKVAEQRKVMHRHVPRCQP